MVLGSDGVVKADRKELIPEVTGGEHESWQSKVAAGAYDIWKRADQAEMAALSFLPEPTARLVSDGIWTGLAASSMFLGTRCVLAADVGGTIAKSVRGISSLLGLSAKEEPQLGFTVASSSEHAIGSVDFATEQLALNEQRKIALTMQQRDQYYTQIFRSQGFGDR